MGKTPKGRGTAGVPSIPLGEVAKTPAEAKAIASKFDNGCVVKSQILGGGRGQARRSSAQRGSDLRYQVNLTLEQAVFGDKINVLVKADIKIAKGSRYFDVEGVKTNPLDLVKDGALNDLLIDTYNGKKIKKKSNGRANGSSNLYFLNGDSSFEELLNSSKKLLYICLLYTSPSPRDS
mgnify:CR=1 FL=1